MSDNTERREPTDAQIIAALNAYQDCRHMGTSLGDWGSFKVERMRAALRAADAVHPEPEPKPKELYEVMGGQGLMRIAKNLTRSEAERVAEKFDRDCRRYGLINPPTRINKQRGRY